MKRLAVYCGSASPEDPRYLQLAHDVGAELAHRGIGLVYGGFSYTRETHEAKVGPVEFSVADRERVNIPVWVGAGAVLLGGVLLLLGRKKG